MKIFLPPRKFKNINLYITIGFLSFDIVIRPETLRPQSELRSGLRSLNEEFKGSGVPESEGGNSPFRGAIPKVHSYSESPYPKTNFTHLLGRFTELNRFPAGPATSARVEVLFGLVNRPEKTRVKSLMCGLGFRVRRIRRGS